MFLKQEYKDLGSVEFISYPLQREINITSHKIIRQALRNASDAYRPWLRPVLDYMEDRQDSESETIFIAGPLEQKNHVEAWVAFGTGFYRFKRILIEDLDEKKDFAQPEPPRTELSWIVALEQVAEFLAFAERFAKEIGITRWLGYRIRYSGLAGRILSGDRGDSFQHWNYRCASGQSEFSLKKTMAIGNNEDRDTAIIDAVRQIFSLFGWPADEKRLREQLTKFFSKTS